MSNLEQYIRIRRREKSILLMTHVIIGYPSVAATVEIITTMANAGADIIELQIPFSDPLADGPVIMAACDEALAQGTQVSDAFILMKKARKLVTIPLIFMAYYNSVLQYGVEKFCHDAKEAGADGLIVPDIPLEEEVHEQFIYFCNIYKLDIIRVISPVATESRLKLNAKIATGFVYATARQGITGVRSSLSADTKTFLKRLVNAFSVPIAVGFGISEKEQITSLIGYADVAVVGSAIITLIRTAGEGYLLAIEGLVKKLNDNS